MATARVQRSDFAQMEKEVEVFQRFKGQDGEIYNLLRLKSWVALVKEKDVRQDNLIGTMMVAAARCHTCFTDSIELLTKDIDQLKSQLEERDLEIEQLKKSAPYKCKPTCWKRKSDVELERRDNANKKDV